MFRALKLCIKGERSHSHKVVNTKPISDNTFRICFSSIPLLTIVCLNCCSLLGVHILLRISRLFYATKDLPTYLLTIFSKLVVCAR